VHNEEKSNCNRFKKILSFQNDGEKHVKEDAGGGWGDTKIYHNLLYGPRRQS